MRPRRFAVGRGDPYLLRYDAQGGLSVVPTASGIEYVIGARTDLRGSVAVPDSWTEVDDATGNNSRISDGEELYAGAGFGDPLVAGQVDDVMWALGDLADRPTGRLLELGCGPGFLLEALGQRLPGWTLTGVDPSPDSVEQARAKGVETHLGFLDTVELDGTFDALVVMGNLQLHPDPVDTLRRLAAVAAPGAAMFLDTKNPLSSARRVASRLVDVPVVTRVPAVHAFAAHCFHGMRHSLSRPQLRQALLDTGWLPQEIRTTGPRLLRFGNTHGLARGVKGRVWKALDKLDDLNDQRAWIQVSARRP